MPLGHRCDLIETDAVLFHHKLEGIQAVNNILYPVSVTRLDECIPHPDLHGLNQSRLKEVFSIISLLTYGGADGGSKCPDRSVEDASPLLLPAPSRRQCLGSTIHQESPT